MKRSHTILLFLFLLGFTSCKKDFVNVNTNPVLATNLDPSYLFFNAEFNSAIPAYNYQPEIVQQLNTASTGVLEGGNHNLFFDPNASIAFNYLFKGSSGGSVSGPVALLVSVINQLSINPVRSNLYNMARILKAYDYMILVDTYGDVPYSQAGKGFLSGINLPAYDQQQVIYDDLLNELSVATAALDAAKPTENADLLYKGNISQWKKLGYSLLLRAAMRFTKVDLVKAAKFANIALTGGVMQSNKDNAYIQFNSTFNSPTGSWFQGTERANVYLAGPFVSYLRSTSDPRLKVISVKYGFPANPLATAGIEDTAAADQIGMPMGYNEASISKAPGFPGNSGAGYKYSQVNRRTLGRVDIPEFFVTYAQTTLLLAEAVSRGMITGNMTLLYNSAVLAHMDQLQVYDPSATVSKSAELNYLALNPFDPQNALQQINTQYWIASFLNGSEAWANFRRSGFPVLLPNTYPFADPTVKGDFIHRLPYPLREQSVNTLNYNLALSHNGPDNLATHLFWDK